MMFKKGLLLISLLFLLQSVGAVKSNYIILQVDVQNEDDLLLLNDVLVPIEQKGWFVTVYMTDDIIGNNADIVRDISSRNHQIALLGTDDLLLLPYEEKVRRLESSINLLRDVLGSDDLGKIHFKLSSYDASFKDSIELLDALRFLNISSETGFHSVDEDFECDYCISRGRIVYTSEFDGVTIIPIAEAKLPLAEVPLDDAVILEKVFLTPDDFLGLMKTELDQEEIVEPRAIIVHPSVIASTPERLDSLKSFLDYVDDNNGKAVLSDKSIAANIAAGYHISYLSASGPSSANPGEAVTITYIYTTTFYCPTFYFRGYGKYPSETDWRLVHSASYYHTVATKTRTFSTNIPDPPNSTDDVYTVRVVGRSCKAYFSCWPTVNSYEKMDEVEITVGKPDLKVNDSDIELSTPTKRTDSITITVTVYNDGNVTARNVKVKISKKLSSGVEYSPETKTIASIAPGASAQVTSTWYSTWRGGENRPDFEDVIKVVVDPDDDIKELNEGNNDAETHRICGTVKKSDTTAFPNIWVQYDQKDAGGAWQFHYATFTDKQGDYCFSTNMDFMVEDRDFRTTSLVKYSPERDDNKILFEVYDDAQWGGAFNRQANAIAYWRYGATSALKKSTNFPGRDITYLAHSSIPALDRLIVAYDYFKNRKMQTKETIFVEVNNNDNAACNGDPTSCATTPTISMWHDRDETDDVEHEYGHLISETVKWNNEYQPVEENWASYASCIARGSTHYDMWGEDIDISNLEDTDGDKKTQNAEWTEPVWDFQLIGVYHIFGADDTITTLGKKRHVTAKDVYDSYNTVKGYTTDAQKFPVKLLFALHGYNTALWPPLFFGLFGGLSPPYSIQAAGADSLTGTFAHGGVDTNADSLYDYLMVNAEVNITNINENYNLVGYVYDSTNTSYCSAVNQTNVTSSGIQNISLYFEGDCIFNRQLNGTLTLQTALLIYQNVSLADSNYNGLNMSYDYTDFNYPSVLFYTRTSVDTAVDNDSDSSYELLQVNVELNISSASNYSIQGILYDSSNNVLDATSTQIVASVGVINVSLNFSGQAIFAGGSNGPYNMSLSAYNATNISNKVYTYHSKIATSAYNYTDFDSGGAGFNSNISESTTDGNNNSLYDAIVLDVSVNTTPAGDYTVVATFTNSSGYVITTATNITNSTLTVQQVYLDFDGMEIRNATQNGPYNITLELKGDNAVSSIGSSTVARYVHLTSSYNYTQFEAYDAEFFSINYSDALSNLVSSKYEYLNITLNFTAVQSDTYSFDGRLYDENGTYLSYATVNSSGSSTLRSIQLAFKGPDINAQQKNGPYNLSLLITDSNNNLVADYSGVYETSTYNYTQFSAPDIYPNGTYSDSGTDENGDGLYNTLNVDVALDIDTSGNYYLTAWIKDANGTGVATASNHSYLSSGTKWVRLPFDGLTIRNHGKNTTFALARLTMYINSTGETVELYDLYNTSSYNYTQFTTGGSIYGKITYANGTGINNSLVTASGSDFVTGYTNASGDFNITGLLTKTYAVEANPPSGENLQKNSTSVYVNGSQASNANLSLPQGAVVTGVILDTDGAPANNVYVSSICFSCNDPSSAYGYTDSNGNYTIAGLQDGAYNLTATPGQTANLNTSSTNFSITTGQTVTQNFTLAKTSSISGYVFNYDGNIVPYPMLHTLRFFYASTSEDPKFTGEANGSFLITGLDNDTNYNLINIVNNTHPIRVNPPAGSELLNITESVYVLPGETAYHNFTLPKSGKVVGLVLDQYGDPVENANLSLKLGSTTVGTATAGSAGNYTLTPLNNGTYTVQLDYPATPTQWLIFVDGVFQAYDNTVQITGIVNQTVYVNFTQKVPEGDWRTQGVVSGDANCTDETVTLAGSVLAVSGNSLTAVNCTLVINGTSDGQYSITVENGATVNFSNSTIQSANSSIEYIFKALPGSTLIIRDSTISDAGYTTSGSYQSAGIYVGSNSAVIERNNITNNYYGIVLYYANNSQVNNNTITDSYYSGVYAYYANNNSITYNTIVNSSNDDGIYLYSGINNTIQNNIVDNSSAYGIYINSGQRNNVSNNTIRFNSEGINIYSSEYSEASFNTIENSESEGIYVNSNYVTLLNNTIRHSGLYGIRLYYSSYGTLSYNELENSTYGGLFVEASSTSGFNHTIDRFNTVNGKQVRYYHSQNDQVLENKYVGHVGIAFSNNITVNNNNITDADGVIIHRDSYNNTISNNDINNTVSGLQVKNSDYNTLASNNIFNSSVDGVYLSNADSNNLSGNNITQSAEDGIDSDSSNNNSIADNVIRHSTTDGISLASSDNNRLENNTVYNSTSQGVYMYYSDNNNLTANTVYNNTEEGIYMSSSTNNNLTGNNMTDNDWNLRLGGSSFSYYNHSIDTSNKVANYSVYYYFNTSGTTLDSATAGQIALAYSSLNTITNNIIASGDGIILYREDDNNTILNNNVTWSKYGIYMYYSDYNNVSSNFVCGSTEYDLYRYSGTDNTGDDNTCTGVYYWSDDGESSQCTTNCTGYTTTTTSTSTTTTINVTTTSLPYIVQVDLQDPVNNQVDYDGNVFAKYRASQKASVVNCSLYTNTTGTWALTQTDTNIENDQVNGFYLSNLANNTIRWNVLCADLWENERFSALDRILTVNVTTSDVTNTQLNMTANTTSSVNLTTGTNVTLDILTNASVTNGRVMITSSTNSTTNGTFSIPYLNTYISIDAGPDFANTLLWAYLTVQYNPTDVTSAGMNVTDLALYWYNQSIGNWQELTTNLTWVYDEGVNATGDYLYANISHFSEYTIAQAAVTAETVQIELVLGWNLISIPVVS